MKIEEPMIRPEDVRKHLDKRPFETFRICLTDGQTYDVRHPDLCLVDRSTVYVGVPTPRRPGVAMDVHHVSLVHVVRFEPLNGNGRRARTRRPPRD
jgi:hypothetical protein